MAAALIMAITSLVGLGLSADLHTRVLSMLTPVVSDPDPVADVITDSAATSPDATLSDDLLTPIPVTEQSVADSTEGQPDAMPKATVLGIATASRFAQKGLYTYTEADPAQAQATAWRASRPADAALMDNIAQAPKARWLGDWNGDIYAATSRYTGAAASANKTPVIVTYNIPIRHCDPNATAGAAGIAAYKQWIDGIARALTDHPGIVIVEPDALGLVTCLSDQNQQDRYDSLRYASKTLSATGSAVYLDASHWVDVDEMAARLRRAGIEYAAGFAINVSNYNDTTSMREYGDQLSRATGGKHYIIDTSRNGSGSNGEWCNALGRSIGEKPQIFTSGRLDAYLWVKYPGESDGTCNGGPNAGQWWPDYALNLLKQAEL